MKATAEARANIALVKYWGRRDPALNLPLTSSLSMTVDRLVTRTTVEASDDIKEDTLDINSVPQGGAPLARVVRHLDRLRERAGSDLRCRVSSHNTFAASAGLASSASAFAALTVAGFAALGAEVNASEASAFARLGSGSAARSIFGGFVEWHAGTDHATSRAEPLAPPSHWDLHDVVAVLSEGEKKVGSSEGHEVAQTSPLNAGRLAEVPRLLREVREGILARDVRRVGEAAEADALLMHAVMMTSRPSLLYWSPQTVAGLHAVRRWREEGLAVYATIDAGPNLHLICEGRDAPEVAQRAKEEFGAASVLDNGPGEGAALVPRHLF
ncbi:MAG TPA: diphosphomevalonate decarboxylase [Candidatus Thermoplasmatota archaeon]|nr:diphosphomevalonate decarboxylase [Candidatus Thermoplasmatota archaeon]